MGVRTCMRSGFYRFLTLLQHCRIKKRCLLNALASRESLGYQLTCWLVVRFSFRFDLGGYIQMQALSHTCFLSVIFHAIADYWLERANHVG